MDTNETIKHKLITKHRKQEFTNNTVSLRGASFLVTSSHLLGAHTLNYEYQDAEIQWYVSQSLKVQDLFDIYGKKVRLWEDASDMDGMINSNYGYCIFSEERGSQYDHCLAKLGVMSGTRQAVMLYQHHDMHKIAGRDFTCTNAVHYYLEYPQDYYYPRLNTVVQMRSNDAVYGFNNDYAWQRWVQQKLA